MTCFNNFALNIYYIVCINTFSTSEVFIKIFFLSHVHSEHIHHIIIHFTHFKHFSSNNSFLFIFFFFCIFDISCNFFRMSVMFSNFFLSSCYFFFNCFFFLITHAIIISDLINRIKFIQ